MIPKLYALPARVRSQVAATGKILSAPDSMAQMVKTMVTRSVDWTANLK